MELDPGVPVGPVDPGVPVGPVGPVTVELDPGIPVGPVTVEAVPGVPAGPVVPVLPRTPLPSETPANIVPSGSSSLPRLLNIVTRGIDSSDAPIFKSPSIMIDEDIFKSLGGSRELVELSSSEFDVLLSPPITMFA